MLTILLLCVIFCFRNTRSSILTAVFKNRNPGIPHSISTRQMLRCCAASLEANYMRVSVDKQTGDCFKILNDGSLPTSLEDYKTIMKTRNTFTLIPQVCLIVCQYFRKSQHLSCFLEVIYLYAIPLIFHYLY